MPENLNFCKNCGIRNEMNALALRNSAMRPRSFAAISGLGTIGLCMFFPLLRELLRSSLDQVAIMLILGAYLVTLFMMFAVLVGHIWKNSNEVKLRNRDLTDKYIAPQGSFGRVTTAQLQEPRDFPGSVTDHTTRTLDHIPLHER